MGPGEGVARRVYVRGFVQGVGFRWHAREAALARGVNGWVKNLPDGRVEAFLEGDADAVERMVEWLRRGPAHAAVSGVEVLEERPLGQKGFEIARGA